MSRKSPTTNQTKRKRILLVDDHPLMRRGQADLLNREPDLEVCGEAGTAREAMETIANLKPDLVLVDMALPDKDGLELIKDIHALHPGLPMLAMSMLGLNATCPLNTVRMADASRSGPSAFITYPRPPARRTRAA